MKIEIIKIILYILFFFVTLYSMEGLNINKFFKQSRIIQARLIYILIAISISYLVTNLCYDFVMCFK